MLALFAVSNAGIADEFAKPTAHDQAGEQYQSSYTTVFSPPYYYFLFLLMLLIGLFLLRTKKKKRERRKRGEGRTCHKIKLLN